MNEHHDKGVWRAWQLDQKEEGRETGVSHMVNNREGTEDGTVNISTS